jgi:hypothetical protein
MKLLLLFAASFVAFGQTAPVPVVNAPATAPTYFSETGVRFSYYDNTLTETTNLGIRLTKPTTQDVPGGLWTIVSVDAQPRSVSPTASFRAGARYYLSAVANHNLVVYANIAAGATTTTTSAVVATSTGTVSTSMLGNLQGGMGFVWRACHTFNPRSAVNCIVDMDYELNDVTSQSVKPIVGLFVGLEF